MRVGGLSASQRACAGIDPESCVGPPIIARGYSYREQWEAGLLAQAIAENADLSPGHRKGVLRAWFSARYNAASFHIVDGPCHPGAGSLVWLPAGPAQYGLHYRAPYGVACPLARVYRQPDGSWAALVIAGVRDSPDEAIIAAERAVARLCA